MGEEELKLGDLNGSGQVEKGLKLLLNLLQEAKAENAQLRGENEALRAEIRRLQKQSPPPPAAGGPKGGKPSQDYSSEGERKQGRPRQKRSKVGQVKVDREEVLRLDKAQLPVDAQFKGYQQVVEQELVLRRENVRFLKEKYYAPSPGHSYMAPLAAGYEGQFGPGVKSLALVLYYLGHMTTPQIRQLFEQVGCQISAGQISQILGQGHRPFGAEKRALYEAGLGASPWQHIDDTGLWVQGQWQHTHIVCNPLYTVYLTTPRKDRLSVLDVLTAQQPRRYRLTAHTDSLLAQLGLSPVKREQVARLTRDQDFDEPSFLKLLQAWHLEQGPQQQQWLLEAAAISAYRAQKAWPVIDTLSCDDAPQFKALTAKLAACWIHDGRHYKKLEPAYPHFQEELDQFLSDYWAFYRRLLTYRQQPNAPLRRHLNQAFDRLCAQTFTYRALNRRIAKTKAKRDSLLQLLDHPELLPHNNPAELAARPIVRNRKISFGPRSQPGVQAWDTFLSLLQTCRKLGLSFLAFVSDRIRQAHQIPPLAQLIAQRAPFLQLDASWRFGQPYLPPHY